MGSSKAFAWVKPATRPGIFERKHRLKHPILPFTLGVLVLVAGTTLSQETQAPHVMTMAEGLSNPVGMALLPNGGLLIAEEGTGENDYSAGVSLLLPDGRLGRLVSGFYSSRDSGDLSGVPLVAVSPDASTIYIGHFNARHLYTLPVADTLELPAVPFSPDDLGTAVERLNNVFLVNPFDMTFDSDGVPVVTDASGNGVATANSDGTARFFHRFDPLMNPENERVTIDPVPTGITRVGSEYYVTLFGGCPYPAGGGELVAIDGQRNQRTVVDHLDMPIDVARADDGTIWVLQFATFKPDGSCFSGVDYQPRAGKLSRLRDDGTLETVVANLDYPGAVLPLADGSLYISEVFNGRIAHITFGDAPVEQSTLQQLSQSQADSPSLAQAGNETTSGTWRFVDVADTAGLHFRHGAFQTRVFPDWAAMMGAGLCWLDYDNDGWLDLYLVNSHARPEIAYWQRNGGLPRNALYRNTSGRFIEVSASSGSDLAMRGNGCVAADLNNDGWTDLIVTADGPNALLWNNGNGTFTEGAEAAGITTDEWNTAAAVADLNGDGWLEVFIGGYIDLNRRVPNPIGAFPQDYFGIPDHLYMGVGLDTAGHAVFREVTREVGMVIHERNLGAIFSDLDNDGDLDLYLANDGQPNRLYENLPQENDPLGIGFRLWDTYETAEVGDRGSGMGVSSGDWDGDGYYDLIVTNWHDELNAIYRNQTQEKGYLNFLYSTYRIGMMGLGNNMTGWGTILADFDHDTDLDLLTVNGYVPMTNLETDAELVRLYGNRIVEGFPGQFREWTEQVGLIDLGPLLSRGSAVADYDNDGDLDIAINTIAGQAALLRNDLFNTNWLLVETEEPVPGLVAEIILPDGQILRREQHTGSSYLASEDPRLHIGLGALQTIPELKLLWPDGTVQQYVNVTSNQVFAAHR
jgi:hypothetical protein